MKKSDIKYAFLSTLPVLAGYIVLGIGFGMVLKAKGFGIIWAFCMGAFIYAGSMQYLAIDLLTAGASLITAAIATVMVNARHIFYGISMLEPYKKVGKIKPYLIFSLTDETYSLVCSNHMPEHINRKHYYILVSLFDHIYWTLGCVLGSVLGTVIKINTQGIDFALTALFVTVFVEQWLTEKDHKSAIIGVLSTVICLIIFGKDNFLIPAMILITLALTALRRFIKEENDA